VVKPRWLLTLATLPDKLIIFLSLSAIRDTHPLCYRSFFNLDSRCCTKIPKSSRLTLSCSTYSIWPSQTPKFGLNLPPLRYIRTSPPKYNQLQGYGACHTYLYHQSAYSAPFPPARVPARRFGCILTGPISNSSRRLPSLTAHSSLHSGRTSVQSVPLWHIRHRLRLRDLLVQRQTSESQLAVGQFSASQA
jgi:hypothetical protein